MARRLGVGRKGAVDHQRADFALAAIEKDKTMADEKKNAFGGRTATMTRLSALNQGENVMVVTRAYGPGGEDLMDKGNHRFSGEPGIRLFVRQGELEGEVILSPFFGDPSKVSEVDFNQNERCELFCKKGGARLREIPELSSEEEGYYYAVYLSPKLERGEVVAVSDVWGNTDSRMMGEEEMLQRLAVQELNDQL